MCLGCHSVAKDNDYIYTGKVTAKGPPAYSAPGYGKTGESVPGYGEKAKEAVAGYGEEAPGYGDPAKSAPGYK
jgi:hypothetical protein